MELVAPGDSNPLDVASTTSPNADSLAHCRTGTPLPSYAWWLGCSGVRVAEWFRDGFGWRRRQAAVEVDDITSAAGGSVVAVGER
jgi:hypothetical protein